MSNITRTNPLIGTQQLVYINWSAGKLEKAALVGNVLIPHQQGFHSDSQARLSVAVHGLPALALEKCVVGGVPAFGHSTAVAAPFGGVVGIYNRELDVFVEAPALKVSSEQVERYPKNFPVELPALRAEPLEVFNGNVSIEFDCEVGDVSDDFSNPVLHEVSFSGPETLEAFSGSVASLVGEALKSSPPAHNLLAFHPDVFPVVELFENPSVWGENGNGKTLAVHIDADNVASAGDGRFFGEKSDDLTVGGQAVSLAHPAISNQIVVSLKVPVLSYRDGNALSWIRAKLDEEPALGVEYFAVPRHVELDGNRLDCLALAAGDRALDVANHLAVEGGGSLAG